MSSTAQFVHLGQPCTRFLPMSPAASETWMSALGTLPSAGRWKRRQAWVVRRACGTRVMNFKACLYSFRLHVPLRTGQQANVTSALLSTAFPGPHSSKQPACHPGGLGASSPGWRSAGPTTAGPLCLRMKAVRCGWKGPECERLSEAGVGAWR